MPRRGENIYKRRDGRYEGRYKKGRAENGRIRWGYVYGREYRTVQKRLVALKALHSCESAGGRGGMALGPWLEYWLESLVRPHIKVSTYAGYRRMLDLHIAPVLGDWQLAALHKECLQSFVEGLGQRLAPRTARGVCRLLRAALRDAVAHGKLACTPYVGIREPRARPPKPRVLTRLEQQRIERSALQGGHLEYLVMLYTGLRLGELCALRWREVVFEESTINVRATLQRVAIQGGGTRILTGSPKTEAGEREVPAPYFIMKLLEQRYEQSDKNPDGFVFHTGKGKHLDPRSVQQRFTRLAKGLGIRGAHVHTLRHTYATRCREQNIGFETLAELMGHSTPQVTLQFYGHCTFENKRRSVQLLKLIA